MRHLEVADPGGVGDIIGLEARVARLEICNIILIFVEEDGAATGVEGDPERGLGGQAKNQQIAGAAAAENGGDGSDVRLDHAVGVVDVGGVVDEGVDDGEGERRGGEGGGGGGGGGGEDVGGGGVGGGGGGGGVEEGEEGGEGEAGDEEEDEEAVVRDHVGEEAGGGLVEGMEEDELGGGVRGFHAQAEAHMALTYEGQGGGEVISRREISSGVHP